MFEASVHAVAALKPLFMKVGSGWLAGVAVVAINNQGFRHVRCTDQFLNIAVIEQRGFWDV